MNLPYVTTKCVTAIMFEYGESSLAQFVVCNLPVVLIKMKL